jgi:lysophospholipase L1-like esterase
VLLFACLALPGCAEAQEGEGADAAAGLLSAGSRRTFASLSHSCAVVEGGLQCWGAAELGQTGDASLARRRPVPVRVPGLSQVQAVAAGGSHTCALAAGRVLCFGDNAHGQGGSSRPFVLLAPMPVPGLSGAATRVAAGARHSCAAAGGRVFCWGRNESGESGAAPKPGCREPFRVRPCSVAATAVEGVPDPVAALALGERHSCALAGGGVFCWGANGKGQLGDGAHSDRERASRVPSLPGVATALASGRDHSCAIVDGEIWCWGDGAASPAPVSGLAPGLTLLAAGADRTCAGSEARVWCFGAGEPPRPIEGVGAPLRALAVSADHACALQGEAVRCWGQNDTGQLGSGDPPRGRERAEAVAAWDRGQLRDRHGDGSVTVVCLGDSNSVSMPGAWPSWCERLPSLLPTGFRVVNRGQGGATATSASLLPASVPLAHALESDAPDVGVLAYGTNDVLAGVDVSEIVSQTARHARRLLSAGALPLVALVPPVRSGDADANRAIDALNAALRQAFAAEHIVDFASGFGDAQLVDRVHLDDAGQQRRARIVAEVLVAFPREPVP